jgi:hypothetical protein
MPFGVDFAGLFNKLEPDVDLGVSYDGLLLLLCVVWLLSRDLDCGDAMLVALYPAVMLILMTSPFHTSNCFAVL